MTVEELSRALSLETVVAGDSGREATGGYCGDLLSWVMGRAPSGCVWLTVMGNVNAVAVAVLADVACILLTEGSPLDEAAQIRAEAQGVAVLRSPRPAYELAVEIPSPVRKGGNCHEAAGGAVFSAVAAKASAGQRLLIRGEHSPEGADGAGRAAAGRYISDRKERRISPPGSRTADPGGAEAARGAQAAADAGKPQMGWPPSFWRL